jgi:hypothetical protein
MVERYRELAAEHGYALVSHRAAGRAKWTGGSCGA